VLALLRDEPRRLSYSDQACARARLRADPERCIARYYEAFEAAREHRAQIDGEASFRRLDELAPLGKSASLHSLHFALGAIRHSALVNHSQITSHSWPLARKFAHRRRSRFITLGCAISSVEAGRSEASAKETTPACGRVIPFRPK